MINIIVLFLLFLSNHCAAQTISKVNLYDTASISKSILNDRVFENWPKPTMGDLSNDGKYFGYTIKNGTKGKNKLVITAVAANWKIEANIIGSYIFTPDSHYALWINDHDSLCILLLKKSKLKYIWPVSFFNYNNNSILYQPLSDTMEFRELKLKKNKEIIHRGLKYPQIICNEKMQLLLQNSVNQARLILLNTRFRLRPRVIWEGGYVRSIIKDKRRQQIAFLSEQLDSLWFYKKGMMKAIQLNIPNKSKMTITSLSHFSENGHNIYINLTESNVSYKDSNFNKIVSIWSYTDKKLQTEQAKEGEPRNYMGVFNIRNFTFFALNKENDWLFMPHIIDTIALIKEEEYSIPGDEDHWNKKNSVNWYMLSLNNKKRSVLPKIKKNDLVSLSPYGKYILYYDREKANYFVYETGTGINRNITQHIEEKWEKTMDSESYGRYISGWEKNDSYVFINGQRDIWQIDPSGQKKAFNVTNGYGKRKNIIFFPCLEEYSHRSFKKNEIFILSAFNIKTKENGFYMKKNHHTGDPDSLTMAQYIYDITDNPTVPGEFNFAPIKALNANKYLVRRMASNMAPNYYSTSDLKHFKQLSDISPQKYFNWYTTELHSWYSLSLVPLQGVLFKPENFDSSKKYPVILHYYDKKSDLLNAFIEPRPLEGGCTINIPYYVSSGYLVFCPDIQYTSFDAMQNAYDAIISAAKYLGELHYVDSSKIGIQGCSWGAIQTNYIVTHTSIFAAACSASGLGNWISNYNSIKGSGGSMQGMYEIGQMRVGGTLWQKPEIYLKNSAVINANKVTSPLLLMHTTDDELFPFSNILEFFYALKRWKKKTWLLQYTGNHGVFGKDEIDFSTRMKQFFDYFLKDSMMPHWMENY